MTRRALATAGAGAFFVLSWVAAAPAWALAPVTFVSGKGVDTGVCASPASPCRTFQYALGQTSPGGEIKALDPADYAPVTIDKSISITGVKGAGVIRATADDAITISAEASGVVNLTSLTIDGFNGTGRTGIRLASAGQLTIRNCAVRNFGSAGAGIDIDPTSATAKFLIEDTIAVNNFVGVNVRNAIGAVRRVSLIRNMEEGLNAAGGSVTTAIDSIIANNGSSGVAAWDAGQLLIAHSTITGNYNGVFIQSGSAGLTSGDNFIRGNNDNVVGALTLGGTR